MKKQTDELPIQVLMTTDTIGGVWTYALELCKVLGERNVHFHLVTMGAPLQPAQHTAIEALENVTVYETSFLLEWMDAPWKSVDEAGIWLLELARKIQPDLVHLNNYAHGALDWKIPVLMVAHSDVFSWWLAVQQTYPPAEWNEYFRRVYSGLQKADFIIAPSNAMLQEIKRIYHVEGPAKVIYNARSCNQFTEEEKEPIVFSCGRLWDEAKNTALLVEAAKRVCHPVRIAGESRFENGYAVSPADNVLHLGKLSPAAVAKEMSLAAVYALPARYEPFGLSVLEAALSGCALVLGNIPSLKEIWGNCACYTATDNPDELAYTINRLLEDEILRYDYSQKALKRARSFKPGAMGSAYLNLYQELLTPGYVAVVPEKITT